MSTLAKNQENDWIIVSELQEEDKEIACRVLIESYQQYEKEYSDPLIWQEYLANIETSFDNPHVDKILVAKSRKEVLGTLQLFQSSEKAYGKPELEIFSPIIRLLGVHPKARGRGVARALLQSSIKYAKEQRFHHLYLHSSDKMYKAIQLYEWLGFKRDLSKEFFNHDILVKCYRLDL
ncbi:GNAT family N-acetyltransferase [Robertmurraya korlensis]|uniref:GNAT family N-acetyltransferase n=1 Tax=Robertmurraya korlensis TaxID=519977 RepID=UPI0020405A87|nr:GNAT family N-acetyltransferase [Robertmurraya korlensis]MCM3601183.1 GNAT family N-acetyltransferase [Robertmurraya korlensis]